MVENTLPCHGKMKDMILALAPATHNECYCTSSDNINTSDLMVLVAHATLWCASLTYIARWRTRVVEELRALNVKK